MQVRQKSHGLSRKAITWFLTRGNQTSRRSNDLSRYCPQGSFLFKAQESIDILEFKL